jgi:hypothetical protein
MIPNNLTDKRMITVPITYKQTTISVATIIIELLMGSQQHRVIVHEYGTFYVIKETMSSLIRRRLKYSAP